MATLAAMVAVCCMVGSARAAELRLGMSAAFNGPSRGLGIELYRGSQAYFEHINRTEGGVFGRRIVIVAKDDGYDPTPAIRNTIDLILNDNVLILFNYVGTPTVTRVLPLLKRYSSKHVVLCFPFTGAQPQREPPYDDYVFNLRASYRQETKELVDKLFSLGHTRIALFYQADAYGRSGWDGVRRAMGEHDLDLAAEATYRRGASFSQSMAEQVDIIKFAVPSAVISVGSYEACAAFVRDARDAGYKGLIANLSFVGSENLLALLEHEGLKRGRSYTTDCINSQVVPSYEDMSLPAVQEYRALMDELDPQVPEGLVHEPYTPLRYSYAGFEGFLNAKVLVEALREYGKLPDRQDLQVMFESMGAKDVGIDAPVTFSVLRHQGLHEVYFTMMENGTFVPVRDWSRWRR
ncbi:MAG: ABC transporter substrate-binding protein [Desulfovibrionaceae bacterium]